MKTLALESLADGAPAVSFVHDFPGSVPTPLYDDVPGWAGFFMRAVSTIVKNLFGRWVCVPLGESGERHVFLSTSPRYPPREGSRARRLEDEKEEICEGTDGTKGSGMYSVGWDCEGPGEQAKKVLQTLREAGVKALVWEHTDGQFQRINAGSQAYLSE